MVIVEAQNVSKLRELGYMVESYAQMVEKQNRTLRREKERAEKLLRNIMPRTVYEEIKAFGVAAPQRYETASILLLDFVGFTQMAVSREPTALVSELNDIFTAFDRIAEQFGCERIKAAGDAYMAVSGVPAASADHAQNIAKAALLFRRYLEKRNQSREPRWLCRIGIGTGPVVGSIVGIQKYVYDMFGPGVNLAARLETLCGPMEILLSEATRRLIAAEFRTAERGLQDLRGADALTLPSRSDRSRRQSPPAPVRLRPADPDGAKRDMADERIHLAGNQLECQTLGRADDRPGAPRSAHVVRQSP